nr:Ppx/GppA phosphatase family protein [Martelella mediterranea]
MSDGGARLNNGGKGKRARRRSRKGRRKAAAGVPASHDAAVAGGDEQARSPDGGETTRSRDGKAARHPSSDRQSDGNHKNSPAQAARDGDKPARRKRKRRRGRRAHTKGPLGADGCKHVAGETTAPVADAAKQPSRADAPPPPRREAPQGNAAAPHRSPGHSLYAALDLGTNNCRLLIAQPTRHHQFRVVDGFSRIVRLGEGLAATGSLSPAAMDRAIEALAMCAAKLRGRSVRRMRLIATEACRSADNGEIFLKRVREETGLELEIVNRETEARLAVSSCASLIGRETRSAVLFDIGGGSSEIAVIKLDENRSYRLANHISHWTSLPVGVVTLSERYGGHDVTPEIFEDMVAEVTRMLGDFNCPGIGGGKDDEGFHLIGTSGTVTTLAGVHLDLPRYDRRKVDGIWLSDDEVTAMQSKLLSWDFAGRAANPCIGPDRADLVLAGCAILEAIRRRWPSSRMRVADRGLREGLLTDMMMHDGVWRKQRRRGGFSRRQGAASNKD